MATRFLQPRQTKYRGIQSNHNSTGRPNSISLPCQSELSGHSTSSTIEDLTARVSTYVITSRNLPDVVRPDDRDLLHDILPYARDIREEEHREEACYTTEAGQCHSPASHHQRIFQFSNPKYACVFICGGDVGGRRCNIQSANTLECPSAKIGLHRVSSLVSLSSPSPLLPLNLSKSLPFSDTGIADSLRTVRTLVRRIVGLELGRRDASRGIELPQTLSAS
jgi:hypothetical protein